MVATNESMCFARSKVTTQFDYLNKSRHCDIYFCSSRSHFCLLTRLMWDGTRQTAFLQAQTHMLSVCGPSGVVYRADKTPFVQDGFRTCVTHQSEEGYCSSLDHSPSGPNCESSRAGNWTETNCLYSKSELTLNIHTHNISILALLTEITN